MSQHDVRCQHVAAASLTDRLHDPRAAEGPFKFLQKEMIFTGQNKGAGEKVTFGSLHMAEVLFQGFTMSPEIFHHEVFAR